MIAILLAATFIRGGQICPNGEPPTKGTRVATQQAVRLPMSQLAPDITRVDGESIIILHWPVVAPTTVPMTLPIWKRIQLWFRR